MVALREIRRYQKSTECLIKRSPFQKCTELVSLFPLPLKTFATVVVVILYENIVDFTHWFICE